MKYQIDNNLPKEIDYGDRFHEALECSSDGILISDEKGNVLFVNKAYEDTTGIKKDEIIGKNLKILLEEKKFNTSLSLNVIENKKPISVIHKYYTGRSALTTATPIYLKNGNFVGVICNTRNITELINIKKELENAKMLTQKYSNELTQLRKEQINTDGLIFKSKKMDETLEFASKVAPFNTTVLISGESGTGKEVLAKYIHNESERKDGPFIKVNCSAIPKDLFESELFGYVEGAFTGASRHGKPGLFELADNGTILLDEIGELPLHVQPKLLRVIQEREVQRLGDKTSIPVDFRLLAATNRELKNDVLEGKFREDLFYRLNVVPINIPPLRERQEDILEIAAYYMKKLNKKYKKNVRVTSEVEDALLNYSWPGNVRELENLVEYLFIVNINDLITIESLPSWVLTEHIMKNSNLELHNSIPRLKYILDMYEKNIITVALSKHSSVKDTAETLDVHPSTLFRKIKKLKIETNLE